MALGSGVSTAAVKTIDLSDLRRSVRISEPQVSVDGRSVAFVLSRPNFTADRYDSQLMLLNIASGEKRALTYDRKDLSSPRWSPSGDRIAFMAQSGSGEDANDQVFVMPMNGGDAKAVTHAPNGVQEFTWDPAGTRLAYVAADEAKNKKAIERHNDAFEVGDNDYLTTAAPMPSHIWIVPAGGGRARRLTFGTWSLTLAATGSQSALSWSPDGKRIAFGRFPNAYYGDADGANVDVVDLGGRRVRRITNHDGLEGQPQYSPTGSMLSYVWPRRGVHDNNNTVMLTAAAGGEGYDVTRGIDRSVDWYRWAPDGASLLIGTPDGTLNALWRQPLRGAAERIDLDGVQFGDDADVGRDGALAFVGDTPYHPSELYYLPPSNGADQARRQTPRRLTDYNGYIASLQLGAVHAVDWTGPKGFHEDGVLTYPPHYVKGRLYPLVLVIHGGPEGSTTQHFSVLSQLLAARGYLVFQPNYRGSTNLGDAYEHGIVGDTGDGPGNDVMAGLSAVERLGIVDTKRIAVSGWSYGGYMTSWLVGHYHNWKAAMEGAALNDWVLDYDISWYVNTDVFYFGGPPWNARYANAWRAQSPIAYVGQITTPTLILADTGDANVPIVNSYEMYHALRDNHVPVQFFAYPVHSHFPGDPVRTADVYRRWMGWMDHYLK